jgi:hypothetical protein
MIAYLINLIVAICFGVMASKRGRNWFAWALIGGVLYFIVDKTVVAVGNSMFGPVSFPDGFYLFFFISTLLDIAVVVVIGVLLFHKQPAFSTPTQGISKPPPIPQADSIEVTCPHCKTEWTLAQKEKANTHFTCPKCKGVFSLPEAVKN